MLKENKKKILDLDLCGEEKTRTDTFWVGLGLGLGLEFDVKKIFDTNSTMS